TVVSTTSFRSVFDSSSSADGAVYVTTRTANPSQTPSAELAKGPIGPKRTPSLRVASASSSRNQRASEPTKSSTTRNATSARPRSTMGLPSRRSNSGGNGLADALVARRVARAGRARGRASRPPAPAALSLHARAELHERPERPRLLRGRVPPLLPAQPV